MNTYFEINGKAIRLSHLVELTTYTVLATVFIGHIFNQVGTADLVDSLIVIAGEIFGLLVSCVATPVSNVLEKMGSLLPKQVSWPAFSRSGRKGSDRSSHHGMGSGMGQSV